jgi:hypothetical protein
MGQTTASVNLDTETVNAGSEFKVSVTVDTAPSYAGNLDVYFNAPNNVAQVGNGIQLIAGQKTATITIVVPIDAIGGTYQPCNGQIWSESTHNS